MPRRHKPALNLFLLCTAASLASVLPDHAAGAPIQWRVEDGGNGHYYEFFAANLPFFDQATRDEAAQLGIVETTPRNWDQAAQFASQQSHLGIPGHLLTLTSQAENQFVTSYFSSDNPAVDFSLSLLGSWLGLYQPPGGIEPDGGWLWVTGEPLEYTAWRPGEPNNDSIIRGSMEEDYGIITSIAEIGDDRRRSVPRKIETQWNDTLIDVFGDGASRFVVEYSTTLVPEPCGALLLASALASLASGARRR